MSWLINHTQSEEYARQAEILYRQREIVPAVEFYRLAANAEEEALNSLDCHKTRTIGITVVSSASLYYKAQEFALAKRIAHKWLATDFLPPFAIEELEELLQVIHYDESRQKSGIQFIEGEVLVSVSGGDIIYGAAPLELILDKVRQIGNIFYRTTEWLLEQPLRKHGEPTQLVKNHCNPWLFQAVPGSYQFAVRVRKPQTQLSIPGLMAVDTELRVEQITKNFLDIVRATAQDPEGELIEMVPQKEYREAFMKLTQSLTPPATGKSFNQLQIKSSGDVEPRPVLLRPENRQVISQALKKVKPIIISEFSENKKAPTTLSGILRGLQLDKDWIELNVDGQLEKIYDAKEEIDDLIGPMVNRLVAVDVIENYDKSQKKYLYRGIQLQEDL